MITIYKYKADQETDEFWIPDKVIKILKIDWMDKELCCWALVDTEAKTCGTVIRGVGTGWDLSKSFLKDYTYVDTIQDGPFVWHYFISKD